MYDKGKILAGIVIFLVLIAYPFYRNMGKASAKPNPKLDTPVIQQLTEKKCIEPKEFMAANHMKLLDQWRDSVVRGGNKIYTSTSGKTYKMSLQNTCMNCHSNKKQFCDECHKYASVKPYCWDCHIVPKERV